MRLTFRIGRKLPKEIEEAAANGEVLFSRTWQSGEIPGEHGQQVEDSSPPETEREAPIDAVAAQPFRLRNLLLIPSALFIVLGAFGQRDWGLYWLLVLLGFAGIAAWEGLRRWEQRL